MHITKFQTYTFPDISLYAYVTDEDDISLETELSPRFFTEEECMVWYGKVASEIFDEFGVEYKEFGINK